jgi:hypothetical protein
MRHIAILILLLLTVFTAFGIPLKLTGVVPVHLDTVYLAQQYHRISALIDSSRDTTEPPLTIIFYRTGGNRKTGIHLPEWGGGGALGRDTIVIPVDRTSAFYRNDLQQIILHEMVHCALARAWGILHIPRWFHEGMAMSLAGDINFEEQVILSRAIVLHTLVPLDSMEHLNRYSFARAQIAYSQAHFAVQFLLTTYGYDLIPELLAASRKYRRFDAACRSVFGLSEKELDVLLKKEMTRRYRLIFILTDYAFLWIGILLLAVVAFIATRIRNRKKRLAMELEEKTAGDDESEENGLTTSG